MKESAEHTVVSSYRTGEFDDVTFDFSNVAAMPGISLGAEEGMVAFGSAPLPESDPWWQRISPTTFYALLAGFIGVFFVLHELLIAGQLGWPLDQSWVHLVYAKHFFHNISFEFNPGERTTGPAGPLWTVVLAFGLNLFQDPFLTGKLLGAIFLFLTGYYAFRLLRTLEFDYGSSLIGGALVATVPRLCWAELSGIESTLACSLVVAGLWAYCSHAAGIKKYFPGVLFGIALLARPETALLFLILLAHWTVSHFLDRTDSPERQRFWKDIGATILAYLLIVLPLLITNQALAGSLLPPTFASAISLQSLPMLLLHGDVAQLLQHVLTSTIAIPLTIWTFFFRDQPALAIACLWAGILLLQRTRTDRDANEQFFGFGVMVIFFFPYFHTLLLGATDEYGAAAHCVQFLSPVFVLTGISAVRIIAERYVLRGPSSRTILLTASLLSLGAGFLALVSMSSVIELSPLGFPIFTISLASSPLLIALFVCLTLAMAGIAFAYKASQQSGTREYAHNANDLDKLRFIELRYGQTFDEKLPRHTTIILRGMLLLLVAWNAAMLPQAASEFATSVRKANTGEIETAKLIAATAAPGSVIATNRPGAMGWFSSHKIVDTDGLLNSDVARSRLLSTAPVALTNLLRQSHADYLVLFGGASGVSEPMISSGFLQQLPSANTRSAAGVIYKVHPETH